MEGLPRERQALRSSRPAYGRTRDPQCCTHRDTVKVRARTWKMTWEKVRKFRGLPYQVGQIYCTVRDVRDNRWLRGVILGYRNT